MLVERLVHRIKGALANLARPRGEIDPGGQPDAADIEHVGQALERHRRFGPDRLELTRALESALLAVEREPGEPRRANERRRRTAITVEQPGRGHGAGQGSGV